MQSRFVRSSFVKERICWTSSNKFCAPVWPSRGDGIGDGSSLCSTPLGASLGTGGGAPAGWLRCDDAVDACVCAGISGRLHANFMLCVKNSAGQAALSRRNN